MAAVLLTFVRLVYLAVHLSLQFRWQIETYLALFYLFLFQYCVLELKIYSQVSNILEWLTSKTSR